jgi:hypothetical protein
LASLNVPVAKQWNRTIALTLVKPVR